MEINTEVDTVESPAGGPSSWPSVRPSEHDISAPSAAKRSLTVVLMEYKMSAEMSVHVIALSLTKMKADFDPVC